MEAIPKKKTAFVEKKNSDSEEEIIELENSDVESEEDSEESEGEEFEDDEINIADLMQTFFAGENGKNIVDTIESLKKSVDSQNKILVKMGGIMEKYFSNVK